MLKTIASVAETVADWQNLQLKTVLLIIALVVGLSSAFVSVKPMLEVPAKLAHHDSTTSAIAGAINRQLCIQVADHRDMDWQMCYTNPDAVIPKAVSP
jgi:hypothetical protein